MNWASLKCQSQGGQWCVGQKITEVYDIESHDIYRSPQEPGFVSWVNLWKERDGTLKCAFIEATGDPAFWPPTYNFNSPGIEYYIKTLVSQDNGTTWTDTGWDDHYDSFWDMNSDHHWRRTVLMPDGLLLRTLGRSYGEPQSQAWYAYDGKLEGKEHDGRLHKSFPFSKTEQLTHPRTTVVEQSTDGGQTWQEVTRSVVSHNSCLLRCRDGRLVVTSSPEGVVLWESLDEGRSWSEGCVVIPRGSMGLERLSNENEINENEIVELSDGRLLLVGRTEGPHTVQAHLTRTGPGQYDTADIKFGPGPHSGYPFLLQCLDGAIWYAGDGSHFVTLDEGINWEEHQITGSYYPQMVEIEPGCLLNITHYGCGDSAFPHPHDVSIRQTRFNYRRADVLEQSDAETPLALSVVDTPPSSDSHMHTWVRADGHSGIAFRVQPGPPASYYVYMLQMELPEAGEVEAGQKVDAFHLLGKVENDQLTILRRRYVGQIALGAWVQMQIRTEGDLLQGAVQPGSAYYLAVRDDSLQEGSVGVVTAASTGAFKVLEFAPLPQLIRNTWWR